MIINLNGNNFKFSVRFRLFYLMKCICVFLFDLWGSEGSFWSATWNFLPQLAIHKFMTFVEINLSNKWSCDLMYNLRPLIFLFPNTFKYLALSIPDEGYSRNLSCTLNLISTFLFKTWLASVKGDRRQSFFSPTCLKAKFRQIFHFFKQNLS